ncbi:MAG TPA: HlyD family type I secretion periplasmic adaptor subunit [Stellaceae bacterium]|nr:HlyD family type I secretion periplasmic adaptor subunit [Stellaceae bacterium]
MKQAQIFVLARPAGRKGQVTVRRRDEPALEEKPERPSPRDGEDEREFSPAALQIVEAPNSPIRKATICAICALFAAALAWSYFGRLAVFTEASGRIQAVGRTKVIEPRITGQISAIRVGDGEHVNTGDVLVEFDPVDALAARAMIVQKLADSRGDIARWQAEIAAARATPIVTDPAIAWPADIPQNVRRREQSVARADLARLAAALADLAAQRREKESEKDRFTASIAAQKKLISVLSETVAMHAQLEKQGWNSKATLLTVLAKLKQAQLDLVTLQGRLADAAAAIPVIDSKIVKTRESFITSDIQSLASTAHEVDNLEQQLAKADQAVANTTLRAPISGTVEASAVTTIGQVVKPGQQLMQIVPDGLPIEIQAYVPNTAIGFIREGMPAEIKINAFPYATYGTIPGTVATVASDALSTQRKAALQTASLDGALSETTAAQKTANLAFPILVSASRTAMNIEGKEIPLSPGMTVTVDIKTEDERAIDYVLDPVIALFSTAAHER